MNKYDVMRMQQVSQIIAVQECSAGNDSVGSEWNETAVFPADTPVSKIIEWAGECSGAGGRLMLTVPRQAPVEANKIPF